MLMNVFHIPGLSKKLLPVNEITKHSLYLDVTFWGEWCVVIDKISNKKIASSVRSKVYIGWLVMKLQNYMGGW